MTQKEKLKAVTEDIRSKLPRLMELEKGCIISNIHRYSKKIILSEILFATKDSIYFKDINAKYFEYRNMQKMLLLENGYKIIGKEPMLNDVMEYMHITAILYSFGFDGSLLEWIDGTEYKEVRNGAMWDLSKPYLKDQSEELINFLHELL